MPSLRGLCGHQPSRHFSTPAASTTGQTRLKAVATGLVFATSLTVFATTATAAPQPKLNPQGELDAPARTAISFTHTPTGYSVGTPNENEARPGLSIVKLYIADYVFKHGTPEDKAKATVMIQRSDDNIASELYSRYPDSINATARAYGLNNTHGAPHWGNSTTSTRDTVTFLEAKKRETRLIQSSSPCAPPHQ